MSQHKSLKGNSSVKAKRNVETRAERIKRMKETGQWKADQKPWGLPKLKPEE